MPKLAYIMTILTNVKFLYKIPSAFIINIYRDYINAFCQPYFNSYTKMCIKAKTPSLKDNDTGTLKGNVHFIMGN